MTIDLIRHAVRNAREDQTITQDELGRRSGVSRQWIASFESGRIGNPRWSSILSVMTALGLELTIRQPVGASSKTPDDGLEALQSSLAVYVTPPEARKRAESPIPLLVSYRPGSGPADAPSDLIQAVLDRAKSKPNGAANSNLAAALKLAIAASDTSSVSAMLDRINAASVASDDLSVSAMLNRSGRISELLEGQAFRALVEHDRRLADVLQSSNVSEAVEHASVSATGGAEADALQAKANSGQRGDAS